MPIPPGPKDGQCGGHFPYVRSSLWVRNIRVFRTECPRLSKRLFAATCGGTLRNSAEKCKFFVSCTVHTLIIRIHSHFTDQQHLYRNCMHVHTHKHM